MCYTRQGVDYFKMIHDAHNVEVRMLSAEAPEKGPLRSSSLDQAPRDGRSVVTLESLVVELREKGGRHSFRVCGVSGGKERFARSFEMDQFSDAKNFIETGDYSEDSSGIQYKWGQGKVEMPEEVMALLKDTKPTPVSEPVPPPEEPKPTVEGERLSESTRPVLQSTTFKELSNSPSLEAPSYTREENDGLRLSHVLKEFQWNMTPPYTMGDIFDDIVSIRSQNGAMSGELIQRIGLVGFDFIAIDESGGCLTAWFKKRRFPRDQSASIRQNVDMEISIFKHHQE